MRLKQNLAKNLKTLRLSREQSLVEFAEEIGISKSTLQNIESEKSSTLDTVDTISENLGIPASVLLSEQSEPDQLNITLLLIKEMEWFDNMSAEDKQSFIMVINNLLEILAKTI